MAHDPVRALVLSGGGSRGAYEAGACIGLLESDYRPDILCGTSVGAINGALIASGAPVEDLARIWRALGTRRMAPQRKDLWRIRRWPSLSSDDPLRRLVEAHIDFDALRGSDLRFLVTAVGLCCGELKTFTNAELTPQHILASAAFPGIYPPVPIGDDLYVDGGVVQNTPLKPVIDAGATEIVAILTDPVGHCVSERPSNLVETLMRVSDIQSHHALHRETHHAQAINALLRGKTTWRGKHRLDIAFVAPDRPLGGTLFQVESTQTEAWLEQGRKDARAYTQKRTSP